MPAQTGTALVGSPINLSGILYNKTRIDTPLFNAFGSATSQSRRFITGASYDTGYPSSAAAGISETASMTAPEPQFYTRENAENLTQIFQRSVAVSYRKMANGDDLTAYKNTSGTYSIEAGQPALAGNTNNVPNELAFQIANQMDAIKLDIENVIINGTFNDSKGNPAQADQTRGLIQAVTSNTIAAGSVELCYDIIYSIAETILKSGSPFAIESYLTVLSFEQFKQLQKVVADEGLKVNQTTAGVNVLSIITPFGTMRFMPHRFMPNGTAVSICMPVCRNVFQPTPGKGNFFYESLAKTGAAEKGQIFGMYGLDYGNEWMHVKVTGLSTTTSKFTAPKVFVENAAQGGAQG